MCFGAFGMIQIFGAYNLSLVVRNRLFAFAKTKTQIGFLVTSKLISAFDFAARIVQSLSFLNLKFQASNYLLQFYSPVCVGPGRKPRRPVFSQLGSFQTQQMGNPMFYLGQEILISPMLYHPRTLSCYLTLVV